MHYYDLECPQCGGLSFEIPDENGDTWCAVCHVSVNMEPDFEGDGETDEESPEQTTHRPQVAQKDRAPELELSERLAGASKRTRELFLTDDKDKW
jgi:uncharacterized Zn finger protein (UPF0148 family)